MIDILMRAFGSNHISVLINQVTNSKTGVLYKLFEEITEFTPSFGDMHKVLSYFGIIKLFFTKLRNNLTALQKERIFSSDKPGRKVSVNLHMYTCV